MKVKEIINNNERWIPNKHYEKVEPEITIILPTFRRAQNGFFENAVMSVINQTYTKWELIIVDDASTDGTEGLIQEFMKTDSRINCIRHKNNVGLPAISEYEGYKRGRGVYYAFIFDDNVWEKDFLFKTLLLMKRRFMKASYGICRTYSSIERNEYATLGQADAFGVQNLAIHNFIANGSVVLHKDVIEDVGLYDPHLTLTRLCDWDLWRRISKKYEFHQTDIWATSEKGVCLDDSLGNSYTLNYWCALERMSENRNERLRPDAYDNIDIVETNEKSTDYYHDTLNVLLEQFDKKIWFRKMPENQMAIESKGLTKKRILVVGNGGLTASVTLILERLFEQSEKFVVKYYFGAIGNTDMLLADALIVCRDITINEFLTAWCNKLNIPCFYYVDDNFIELAKEIDDPSVALLARTTNRTVLNKYNAVITTTLPLKKYFEDHLLHDKVLLMEPFVDSENMKKVPNLHEEVLSIGFLGGGWRNETFDEYVLPAVKRLSKTIKVTVHVPLNAADIAGRKKYQGFADDNLEIEFIDKTLSLNTLLQRTADHKIDIMVHCGKSMLNNEYKTENALINATQVGAVLLVSREQPYTNSPVVGEAFELAENTIDSWHEKMFSLKDIKRRKTLFEAAYKYCMERYSFDNCAKDFLDVMHGIRTKSYYNYFERALVMLNSSNAFDLSVGTEQSFRKLRLGLGTLIDKEISYNFTCSVNELRELGVLFGSFDLACRGQIKLSLLERGNLLFEQWFSISHFVRDEWTYIDVGIIPNARGKVLTIKFVCDYEKESARIGFFENLDRRSFWYKVCNKLGHHIRGLDAIVTDCR